MSSKRPQPAAFFDLDRTLIGGPSAPAFTEALDAVGIPQRHIPGTDIVLTAYRWFGENFLTPQGAKSFAGGNEGWDVGLVEEAAQAAADALMDTIQPYAPGVIAEHHAAGRKVVMATTSPAPLVTALADRLGCDAVVATEWAHDGTSYTGQIDGPIVWGRGKLDAVRGWAAENNVDVAGSWAYSDSYYDAPLLDAVRHPTAVNPDFRLVALSRLKGWPIRHLDKPEGVLKIAGRELQDWTRPLQRPEMLVNVQLDVEGVDTIPSEGPCILVFNHRSYFDATVVGSVLGGIGRPVRFLGKKEVFDAPVVGYLAKLGGGIRVNRSSGSSEPLDAAIKVLQAGDVVALAPEGTIPRGPAFFDTVLKGRYGAARLAQAAKAPVIPVGLWGTEKVWPRNQRLPKLSMSDRPEIRVRVGPPVKLNHRSLDADTKKIMKALVDQLPPEARRKRTPTTEELMATYPPGYSGDPTKEAVRRPGTDT